MIVDLHTSLTEFYYIRLPKQQLPFELIGVRIIEPYLIIYFGYVWKVSGEYILNDNRP